MSFCRCESGKRAFCFLANFCKKKKKKKKMGSADHQQEQLLLQQLQVAMPVSFESVVLPSSPHKHVGLVVVDEVNGFCTVGAGNLVSFSHHHHHVGHVSGYTISISQSAQTEKNSWNSKISLRS